MPTSDKMGSLAFVLIGAIYGMLGLAEKSIAAQLGDFTAAGLCIIVALAIAVMPSPARR